MDEWYTGAIKDMTSDAHLKGHRQAHNPKCWNGHILKHAYKPAMGNSVKGENRAKGNLILVLLMTWCERDMNQFVSLFWAHNLENTKQMRLITVWPRPTVLGWDYLGADKIRKQKCRDGKKKYLQTSKTGLSWAFNL